MMRVVNGEGERSQNNKLQFPYRFAQYSIRTVQVQVQVGNTFFEREK